MIELAHPPLIRFYLASLINIPPLNLSLPCPSWTPQSALVLCSAPWPEPRAPGHGQTAPRPPPTSSSPRKTRQGGNSGRLWRWRCGQCSPFVQPGPPQHQVCLPGQKCAREVGGWEIQDIRKSSVSFTPTQLCTLIAVAYTTNVHWLRFPHLLR